jgi:hypothetical protein
MPEVTGKFLIKLRLARCTGGVAIVVLCAIMVYGQSTPRRAGSDGTYPRLPGAVTRAPQGLADGAPFDVAKFFEALPRDQNAAPLYLDALFEFDSVVEICFPEGPDRARRRQVVQARSQQYGELTNRLQNDPKSVAISEVDSLIKLYETGFRKLAEAQRRERCVFEPGVGIAARLPHVQSARPIARVACLRVQRAVQRGDFVAATRDVDTVLRLARDLRPRGFVINQLVADAITQLVCASMVKTILASPALRSEHCDRLLEVLIKHEARSIDGYLEGLRASYVTTRVTLRDVVQHQREMAKAMGLKPGESVVRALVAQAEGPAVSGKANAGADPTRTLPEDWDAQVAETPATEMSRRGREVDRYYGALMALGSTPYAARIERLAARKPPGDSDPLSRALRVIMHTEGLIAFVRAESRTVADVRGAECLVALRRWQFSHRETPSSLARVIGGSALTRMPADPFDGKPFRMTVIDGKPVIYSIGRDGKDDGGQQDSKFDSQAGDLIYQLPPQEDQPVIRPASLWGKPIERRQRRERGTHDALVVVRGTS